MEGWAEQEERGGGERGWGGEGKGGGEEEGAGAGSASPPIAHHPHTTMIASITDGDGDGGDGGARPRVESGRVGSLLYSYSCVDSGQVQPKPALPCATPPQADRRRQTAQLFGAA